MASTKKEKHRMTPEELEVIATSRDNPNRFFEYWFKKPGLKPFQLDYNFDEDAKWQEAMCMTAKSTIAVISGIGTGKTLAVGLSACFHATITQSFRFLNIAHELDQSKIMYDLILEFAKNTRFDKLITKRPASPHPKIQIEFIVETDEGDIEFSSLLEFYSAGESGDAMNIFSKRFDWINIEEAGRFDNLITLIGRLTTRLTGNTAMMRPYMGRLSVISNPIENPELWAFFDECIADTEHNAVFLLDTQQNKNITEKQVAMQLRNIPEEEQQFYLKGERPEGRGSYFSKAAVHSCESELLTRKFLDGLNGGIPGFAGISSAALGYYDMTFAREPDHYYIVVGDPGISNAPKRNSPVVIALDVTQAVLAPSRAEEYSWICGLWWGHGGGSIMPWVSKMIQYIEHFQPMMAGCDSTSTQKNMAELMNAAYIHGKGYSVSKVHGLDFSGAGKFSLLLSARLAIDPEKSKIGWPDILAKSLSSQLIAYDIILDRTTNSKLAQDLVATLAMGTRLIAALPKQYVEEKARKNSKANVHSRESRHSNRTGQRRSHVTRSRAGR